MPRNEIKVIPVVAPAVVLLECVVRHFAPVLDWDRTHIHQFPELIAILLMITVCFVSGIGLRTGPGLRAKNALERTLLEAGQRWTAEAQRVSRLRRAAAPKLAAAVTQAMQQLGMAGGRFEVALPALDTAQSFGLENVELQVAGHAGSSPRPLAKVASGGELSRLALAIAVTTARAGAAQGVAVPTLIFDEIDAGVGGNVAYQVGRLMKQLGGSSQVLAVTHLAQVAACADHHFVVSKALQGQATVSDVAPVSGEARVSEVARMLGGERLSDTSRAHALAMLDGNAQAAAPAPGPAPRKART